METIGRTNGGGPRLPLGRYLARDGSSGGDVALDCSRPHAACLLGKRGSGKSNTLALLAEGLLPVNGVVPVVVDPMGAFTGLDTVGATVREPRVSPTAIPPREWPRLVGLDPTTGAGALVWTAATACSTVAAMQAHVVDEQPGAARRVAANHLARADAWDVFAPDGLRAPTEPTVLDLSECSERAANAVVRAVATGLYERRLADEGPLPWLLVDEAHLFLDGVAAPALDTVLTRGRAPGVSLVLATQRPDALPETAISQADLLATHRLTGRADTATVAGARGDYVDGPVERRIPSGVGELLVFDDATERAHSVRIDERTTPHGGTTPTVGTDGYE
ncbi:ATPase [Halobacteriales archaeon SW_8_65_20]|nr:MAG: ATPase [Halobacteriales archaeon SW_8_65_20]